SKRSAVRSASGSRESHMFETSDRSPSGVSGGAAGAELENHRSPASHFVPDGTNGQKIFLPRGSAQSQLAPQPYYSPASENGLVPSWVTTEKGRQTRVESAN